MGHSFTFIFWLNTLGFLMNILIIFILLINYRYKQFNCLYQFCMFASLVEKFEKKYYLMRKMFDYLQLFLIKKYIKILFVKPVHLIPAGFCFAEVIKISSKSVKSFLCNPLDRFEKPDFGKTRLKFL